MMTARLFSVMIFTGDYDVGHRLQIWLRLVGPCLGGDRGCIRSDQMGRDLEQTLVDEHAREAVQHGRSGKLQGTSRVAWSGIDGYLTVDSPEVSDPTQPQVRCCV